VILSPFRVSLLKPASGFHSSLASKLQQGPRSPFLSRQRAFLPLESKDDEEAQVRASSLATVLLWGTFFMKLTSCCCFALQEQ
jgi:hypothetical protein